MPNARIEATAPHETRARNETMSETPKHETENVRAGSLQCDVRLFGLDYLDGVLKVKLTNLKTASVRINKGASSDVIIDRLRALAQMVENHVA